MKASVFWKILWKSFCWVFGVLTCAYYAYVTEVICSQSSYLWALCAPLVLIAPANAAVLLTDVWKVGSRPTVSVLGTLNGLAIIVASVLTLVLSPLCALATILMGVVVYSFCYHVVMHPAYDPPGLSFVQMFGIALFYSCVAVGPLTTALIQRIKLINLARQLFGQEKKKPFWLPMSTCAAMVISFVLIATFPTALTRAAAGAVTDGSMLPEGLLLLRAAGSNDELLRACYDESSHMPWFFQFWMPWRDRYVWDLWSNGGWDAKQREIYYRVTGKPFNSVARPSIGHPNLFLPFDPFSFDDSAYDYQYDQDFAGEAVGGIVRGLSLTKSSISGWADASEAVAHLTWNMDFNCPKKDSELRAQILLPPHAVVTRCSLWVNGVERHAVIATRESSRTAYHESAQMGEKPLLLSTAGAGRVLLQSSTGWWGSDAKLKIEFTAPLVILAADKAALPMPMFTERNFSVATNHQIMLTSSTPAHCASLPGAGEIKGELTNAQLTEGGTITFSRNPSLLQTTGQDPADKNHDIVQEIRATRLKAKTPLVVVVDGSSTMADLTSEICDALMKADARSATIIWAADVPRVVVSDIDTTSPEWKAGLDKLKDSSALGGQNNAEALSTAVNRIGSRSETNIVWLHGPQPVKFSGYILLPLLEKAQGKIKLYEYQMLPGPNEVIKSLDQSSALIQVPRMGNGLQDLDALMRRLSGSVESFAVDRRLVEHAGTGVPTAKHASELAALYVGDLVLANLSDKADRTKYGTMAEQHSLVTPLTSALVLEKENYAERNVVQHSGALASKDANVSAAAPGGVAITNQLSSLSSASAAAPVASANAGSGSQLEKSYESKASPLSPINGLIPVKPEPPMYLLILAALSMVTMLLWIRRKREKRA